MSKLCSVCKKLQFETPSGLTCEDGHGGAPSIVTDKEHEDGERIDLGEGWYMELDGSTREEGELQGFVYRPDGRDSASLSAARSFGHLTGGYETTLTRNILMEIKKRAYDEFE